MGSWIDGWVNLGTSLRGREGGHPRPKYSQRAYDLILSANVRV